MTQNNSSNGTSVYGIFNGDGSAGSAQSTQGITTKAFALNLATGLGLFLFEISGFFLLKSADIGRRLYQPKTYLVQDRLRVEAIPTNPLKWFTRIFNIQDDELKLKCGLDGYFFIRFIRAMIIVFLPLMAIIVTVLLPVNYHGGKAQNTFVISGHRHPYNVTGLDTLSWQNVAPTQTNRYWAHLVCALLAISWTLFRIYREKLHFIDIRQQYLLSPEHRLKASARTVLVTNIPKEFQSNEALAALYDVFVDNDDRKRLHIWVNRDYGALKTLVLRRRKLRHALEKAELRILRQVNKQRRGNGDIEADEHQPGPTTDAGPLDDAVEVTSSSLKDAREYISAAFEADCRDDEASSHRYLKTSKESFVKVTEDGDGGWQPVSSLKRHSTQRSIPKRVWLRAEISRLTVQIGELMQDLDSEVHFKRQNSAFIQFDRQMAAHMACSLVAHHLPGRMSPRFLDVAPHEILWPNMDLTSLARFVRRCIALFLFVGMLILWGIPTTFLGFLSQLETLRDSTSWLAWLKPWPSYLISLISGPLTAILLALLVQLVVPALCRKLAVLVGSPTRSKREVVTQGFYFTFLFIELVLVTSISSGIIATIPVIIEDPTTIPTTLATNLPKAANYFFNYLIIQGLAFSGSVLFQYLRVLYITTIWPWFTQTPREEAWLQTTIPHQMWGNVYPLITNFAVIGLIYSIIAPLMLIFVSGTFMLFWVAYRHNYYYVQRVKVDTHGLLYETALSQLFAGIYVLEVCLIGLFFLVRNTDDNLSCKSQAIIMIVALVLTMAYQYILEQYMRPLYELLPVSLEDSAADAERRRFLLSSDTHHSTRTAEEKEARGGESVELPKPTWNPEHPGRWEESNGDSYQHTQGLSTSLQINNNAATDANTTKTLSRLKKRIAVRLANSETHAPGRSNVVRRLEVGNEMAAALAEYPDELTDLSVQEREAELRVAYQDPITREPAPVIWIPQDLTGISKDMIKRAELYSPYLQYSDAGAYLTTNNKCEVTRPAPDVRTDWLLDWVL